MTNILNIKIILKVKTIALKILFLKALLYYFITYWEPPVSS